MACITFTTSSIGGELWEIKCPEKLTLNTGSAYQHWLYNITRHWGYPSTFLAISASSVREKTSRASKQDITNICQARAPSESAQCLKLLCLNTNYPETYSRKYLDGIKSFLKVSVYSGEPDSNIYCLDCLKLLTMWLFLNNYLFHWNIFIPGHGKFLCSCSESRVMEKIH